MTLVLVGGLVGLDQATKLWAQATLARVPTQIFVGDLFRLQYVHNTGSFLGLGSALPEWARFWIFSVAVSLVLLGAIGYLIWGKPSRWMALGLALVIGGGIGNQIDRILYGYVIDFMNVGLGWLRTGIFNIADMAIMAGTGVIGWESFKMPEKK